MIFFLKFQGFDKIEISSHFSIKNLKMFGEFQEKSLKFSNYTENICSFIIIDAKTKILKLKTTLKSSSDKRGFTEILHISQITAFENKNSTYLPDFTFLTTRWRYFLPPWPLQFIPNVYLMAYKFKTLSNGTISKTEIHKLSFILKHFQV